MEIHDTLNPKIFSDNKLKPEIRSAIQKIVGAFVNSLSIKPEVLDVQLVGSNASYNYTPHSDLDVHLVTNFEMITNDVFLLQALYNAEKASFNKNHDIFIKGINVELYIEDVNAGTASNGVYSITKDDWIKFPKKILHVPTYDLSRQVETWKERIEKALTEENLEEVKNIVNTLYMIRKNSIAIDGEYGKGNQLFKEIRNLGLLDILKQKINEFLSKELSVESLEENYTYSQLISLLQR